MARNEPYFRKAFGLCYTEDSHQFGEKQIQVAQAQIIDGTSEEIAALLQQGAFAGQKLRVIVEPEEEEDLAAGLPDPPFTVRDQAHLEELLLEGLKGPFHEFTDAAMEDIRQEVHRRHAARQKP